MNILAIVQARVGSSRLFGKVLREVEGRALIDILLYRLSRSEKIDRIIVATGDNKENDALALKVRELGFEVFRGSEHDVLDRYFQAAKFYRADAVVRITGDCPLVDPELVDSVISLFKVSGVDYCSNTIPPTFPDGLDVEIFSFTSLQEAWESAVTNYDREHVTPFIKTDKRKFKTRNFYSKCNLEKERWTVDEVEDLEVIRSVIRHFSPSLDFRWEDVLNVSRQQPELFKANREFGRDEGSRMSAGQKLYNRAKRIIPGGTMAVSKRSEIFLPEKWPAYFSRAKGCRIWDLDGREFIDISFMGMGTSTLGYGHPEVDSAVQETVRNGNMTTLNCPEEVHLAQRLLELHPWADMARFTRSGGEANSVAIRIARAATGKDNVAVCGHHGWHDWYLSAYLGEEIHKHNQGFPRLSSAGVPSVLKGTVLPFRYNDFEQLEQLVSENQIGVIMMGFTSPVAPEEGYLRAVRQLATDHDIVLVFDERDSGFRGAFGGLHLKYNVMPDVLVLGKALGNGYAINAILGRGEVMHAAQSTFLSSTFWTERIGPVAALKTLEVMEKIKSWETISETGKKIGCRWKKLGDKYEIPLSIKGSPAMSGFSIPTKNREKYRTLITQEMHKYGILATTSVYVCIEHTDEVLGEYFERLESVFSLMAECESGRDIDKLLEGPICHSDFGRFV